MTSPKCVVAAFEAFGIPVANGCVSSGGKAIGGGGGGREGGVERFMTTWRPDALQRSEPRHSRTRIQ